MSTLRAIALLILLSAPAPAIPDLAYIIQGEAGTCPTEAMIAMAHLYQRNPHFNGWQEPEPRAIHVALNWQIATDPTPDAQYWFDADDITQANVQAIIGNTPPLIAYECAANIIYLYPKGKD